MAMRVRLILQPAGAALRNTAICWLAGAVAGAQLAAMSGPRSGREHFGGRSKWPLVIGALAGCVIGAAAGLGVSGYRCLYKFERRVSPAERP
jgi:hypothetical protein